MDLRTYPVKYIRPVYLKDKTLVQLRPIHPVDGHQATKFKASLSLESIYSRFHGYIPAINEQIVKRLTELDYRTEMAIVAEVIEEEEKQIIAVGRVAAENEKRAELAVIIADQWQGKGLGSILVNFVIKISRDMGFEELSASVFSRNIQMLEILRHEGFSFFNNEDKTSISAHLTLT